jgi:hypothetical protein
MLDESGVGRLRRRCRGRRRHVSPECRLQEREKSQLRRRKRGTSEGRRGRTVLPRILPLPLLLLPKPPRFRLLPLPPLRPLFLLHLRLQRLRLIDVSVFERALVRSKTRIGRGEETVFDGGELVELEGEEGETVVAFGVWKVVR